MTRVLFVGQKPETVDYSDPALPPGLDADKIEAGIVIAAAKLAEQGWEADLCMIAPDESAEAIADEIATAPETLNEKNLPSRA